MSKIHNYTVKRVKTLSENDKSEVARQITHSFRNDPSLNFLFECKGEITMYVDVILRYYLKMGMVLCALDDEQKVQGIALWNEPGGFQLSIKNLFWSGLLGSFFIMNHKLSRKSRYRVNKVLQVSEKQHMKEPHYYLFLLAAFLPGAGTALMEYANENYTGFDFYLENSNPEKNNAFYARFGFIPQAEIRYDKCFAQSMRKFAKAEGELTE